MNGNPSAWFAKEFCGRSSLRRFARLVGVQGWKVICIVASPLIIGVRQSIAQSQPATIPTVVAQAMAFEPAYLGRPQFFDARTPTDWPAALVPPAVKVVGGGIIGDSAMYRMRVAVFEFSARGNPKAVIEDMIVRAGYGHPTFEPPHSQTGSGFANTPAPAAPSDKYCKGSTLAAFGPMDSVRAPRVFAVFLLDGEAGRENCSPRGNEAISDRSPRFPAKVPHVFPPAGAMSLGGGGSGWSSSGGHMTSMLRTTMPTDSLLAHYSKQLVAGGWKTEGRPANADGVGAQRFSFREGQDAWTGALIVFAVAERREIMLQVSKRE